MDNKSKYRELCNNETSIPIFNQAWWLDCVCGINNWDVSVIEDKGEIVGALPYFSVYKFKFNIICHPGLTQTMGPWLKENDNLKRSKKISNQKNNIMKLLQQLPEYSIYNQNWNSNITNWLPAYWLGYNQTTKYTYKLYNIKDLSNIYGGFESNIKGDIKKAQNRYNLKVSSPSDLSEFISLISMTYDRQSKDMPHTKEFIINLINEAINRRQGKCLIAKDETGKSHAGVFFVWDNNTTYYLLGGGDPKLRNSGATSLCLWEAIQLASTVSDEFDFEGSMIEPIERFFRAFGSEQVPYFSISKCNSKLLKVAKLAKELF